jgi:hypothetical protein
VQWHHEKLIESPGTSYGVAEPGKKVHLLVDEAGTLHLLFFWEKDGMSSVQYASKPKGGEWTVETLAEKHYLDGHVGLYLWMLLDLDDGAPIVLYQDRSMVSGDDPLYTAEVIVRKKQAGEWQEMARLSSSGKNIFEEGTQVSACMTPDGIIHVVYGEVTHYCLGDCQMSPSNWRNDWDLVARTIPDTGVEEDLNIGLNQSQRNTLVEGPLYRTCSADGSVGLVTAWDGVGGAYPYCLYHDFETGTDYKTQYWEQRVSYAGPKEGGLEPQGDGGKMLSPGKALELFEKPTCALTQERMEEAYEKQWEHYYKVLALGPIPGAEDAFRYSMGKEFGAYTFDKPEETTTLSCPFGGESVAAPLKYGDKGGLRLELEECSYESAANWNTVPTIVQRVTGKVEVYDLFLGKALWIVAASYFAGNQTLYDDSLVMLFDVEDHQDRKQAILAWPDCHLVMTGLSPYNVDLTATNGLWSCSIGAGSFSCFNVESNQTLQWQAK